MFSVRKRKETIKPLSCESNWNHCCFSLLPPHSSAVGSALGQSCEDSGQTSKACPESLWHPLILLCRALLLPFRPCHTGSHVCPVPPSSAGGHRLHTDPGDNMGCSGEPIPAAACQTLCDRCGLWLGYGLLPVELGRKVSHDLGLSAGPTVHAAVRDTHQVLRWTLARFSRCFQIGNNRFGGTECVSLCGENV